MRRVRQVVRAVDVPPRAWANGAGATRQLWIEWAQGDPGFTWRLSLADLAADAPFSRLPGVDRVLLPLHGIGMLLTIDGRPRALSPLSPVRFAGEADVSLSTPGPGLALNLMTRRGISSDLLVRRVAEGDAWVTGTRAVVVREGHLTVDDGVVLNPLDVAVLDSELLAAEGTRALVADVLAPESPAGQTQ